MSLVTYLKEGEKKNKNTAAYSELLELLGITPREIPEVGADPKSCMYVVIIWLSYILNRKVQLKESLSVI